MDYSINGTKVTDDKAFRNQKVYFDHSLLKPDSENTIEMFIFNKYVKNGLGLHSYIDTADQE